MNRSAKDEYNRIRLQLEPHWGTFEANSLAYILLDHFYRLSRNNIHIGERYYTSKGKEYELSRAMNRLEKKEPIQYVMGYSIFSGLRLVLNQHTLIPRPETEELVDLIVKENKLINPNIIDIGTGSGCIAIALANLIPGAEITATDIDNNAITIAEENAEFNHVNLILLTTDIIYEDIPGSSFDIIVSNPPYVRYSEKDLMDENVLNYEPELALYVTDEDPLIFYKTIANKAKKKLRPGGYLYFEINEAFGEEVCELLSDEGYRQIELFNDIHDRPRNVRAVFV